MVKSITVNLTQPLLINKLKHNPNHLIQNLNLNLKHYELINNHSNMI